MFRLMQPLTEQGCTIDLCQVRMTGGGFHVTSCLAKSRSILNALWKNDELIGGDTVVSSSARTSDESRSIRLKGMSEASD